MKRPALEAVIVEQLRTRGCLSDAPGALEGTGGADPA